MLRRELARKSYRPDLVAIGSATDCYQPVERELRLTRGVIEVLHEARHPFSLVTKSSGVERDLDLDLDLDLIALGCTPSLISLTVGKLHLQFSYDHLGRVEETDEPQEAQDRLVAELESVFDFPMITLDDGSEAYGELRLQSLGMFLGKARTATQIPPPMATSNSST